MTWLFVQHRPSDRLSFSVMSNQQQPRRPHILIFPFPAQGHIIPMLDLAHHLAAAGLSLTVLVTPKLRPLLDPFVSSSISPLVLPLPPHPSLPPGTEQVRDLPAPHLIAALMQSLAALRPQIIAWAHSHPNPPSALLSEFFLGWTHHLAADLNIPRLTFYSSNTLLAAVVDRAFRHLPEDAAGVPVALPGLPSFPYAHIPSIYRRYRQYTADAASGGVGEWEFAREAMLANWSSWGAVFNTLEALEPAHLARIRDELGHGRVWAVGPIAPAVPAASRGGEAASSAAGTAIWLDVLPARSVIYVCFGSQFWPTVAQSRALASALELSQARFVWAVGGDRAAEGGTVVPEGFDERVAGRGLVIRGWAPQVAVLGHPAVGAFLTHCGWNSVLEGIAAGVTLLAWPMEADQFINARLLVEETGVAVRVCEGAGAVPDVEVLAAVLAESVEEGKWAEIRERAGEMARKAREAVAEGGSSFKDMELLVKELSSL